MPFFAALWESSSGDDGDNWEVCGRPYNWALCHSPLAQRPFFAHFFVVTVVCLPLSGCCWSLLAHCALVLNFHLTLSQRICSIFAFRWWRKRSYIVPNIAKSLLDCAPITKRRSIASFVFIAQLASLQRAHKTRCWCGHHNDIAVLCAVDAWADELFIIYVHSVRNYGIMRIWFYYTNCMAVDRQTQLLSLRSTCSCSFSRRLQLKAAWSSCSHSSDYGDNLKICHHGVFLCCCLQSINLIMWRGCPNHHTSDDSNVCVAEGRGMDTNIGREECHKRWPSGMVDIGKCHKINCHKVTVICHKFVTHISSQIHCHTLFCDNDNRHCDSDFRILSNIPK